MNKKWYFYFIVTADFGERGRVYRQGSGVCTGNFFSVAVAIQAVSSFLSDTDWWNFFEKDSEDFSIHISYHTEISDVDFKKIESNVIT